MSTFLSKIFHRLRFQNLRRIALFFLISLGVFYISGDFVFAVEASEPVVDEATTDKIIEILNYITAAAATIL